MLIDRHPHAGRHQGLRRRPRGDREASARSSRALLRERAGHAQRLRRARGRRLLRRLRPEARRAGALRADASRRRRTSIMSAVGGENVTTTIEGRARYPVNVRYPRELRDDLDAARARAGDDARPARRSRSSQVAEIRMVTGPSMIRNENGLLAGYVFVDMAGSDVGGYVDARQARGRDASSTLPAGYSLEWSGQYENMLRVRERLKLVVPVTLFLIFFLLYLNTKSGVKAGDRAAGGAVLGGRRGLADVAARLQRLDRGLGGDDRAHGPRRRDRRLHAALPRPRLRRGEGRRAGCARSPSSTRRSSTAPSSACGRS